MLDPMFDGCIKLHTKTNLDKVKKDFKVYCYARIYVLCKSENSSDQVECEINQVESENSTNQVESENKKTQKKKKQNIRTTLPKPIF